jgi:mannose-6-phosphate isomerase-like protein (cupin superfamily)
MGLKANLNELMNCHVAESQNIKGFSDVGLLDTRMVYGESLSMSYSKRESGYYSGPQVHDTEQLNYVLSGEISIYMFNREYRLKAGDFMHIPKMAVHWACTRGTATCKIIETHNPPNIGKETVCSRATGLFEGSESVKCISETIQLTDKYAESEEEMPLVTSDDPYWISGDRIQPSEHKHMRSAGGLFSLYVHAYETNLMIARRGPGYHSTPHVHQAEQMNFLLSGRLWIFAMEKAFLLKAGVFFRIPAMVPHWAWNDGDEDCQLIEAHSPILDASGKDNAAALFPQGDLRVFHEVRNYFVPEDIVAQESAWIKTYLKGDESK